MKAMKYHPNKVSWGSKYTRIIRGSIVNQEASPQEWLWRQSVWGVHVPLKDIDKAKVDSGNQTQVIVHVNKTCS